MKCEKCKKEHRGKYASGRFCSVKCARSFSTYNNRKQINEKRSKSNKKYWNKLSDEEKNKKLKILTRLTKQKKIEHLDFIFNQDWDCLGIGSKRLKVILEQNGKCNKCEISEWNGTIITLEYEHKDGNNKNNSRENVEALCPNCHSQTPTWRGRNIKNKISKKQKVIYDYLELL